MSQNKYTIFDNFDKLDLSPAGKRISETAIEFLGSGLEKVPTADNIFYKKVNP